MIPKVITGVSFGFKTGACKYPEPNIHRNEIGNSLEPSD